ncbi:MAG: membrane protein insertase YidC, partial [Oceanisphaera sp.]
MESQRNILIIALLLVSFLIWQQWTAKDVQPETAQKSSQTTQVQANQGDDDFIPQGDQANDEGEVPTDASSAVAKQHLITVTSDTLKLTIDTQGGDVVRTELLEHDDSLDSDDKFVLLANNADFVHVAQSGLIGRDGPDSNVAGRPIYHSEQQQYVLADGQDSLTVPMTFTNDKGVVFTKNFTLTR